MPSDHVLTAESWTARAPHERCLLCPCNAGICNRRTSNTPANPGRDFYSCSSGEECPIGTRGFFKWADTVRTEELIIVPYCGGCDAGVCRVRRESSGPNAGRILFLCSVKEGEGSCGYRVWQDELDKLPVHDVDSSVTSSSSSLGSCSGTSPPVISLAEESTPSEKGPDDESPVLDSSQHVLQRRATNRENHEEEKPDKESTPNEKGPTDESPVLKSSQQVLQHGATCGKMKQLKRQEEKPEESLWLPNKRFCDGKLKAPATFVSEQSQALCLLRYSVLVKQECWMRLAIRQNLGPQLKGWWGRLVFPPLPSLIMPEPMTCIGYENLVEFGASTTLTRSPVVESSIQSQCSPDSGEQLSGIIDLSSSDEPFCKTGFSNVMSESVSKAFTLAAEHLQSDFLVVLESMDPKDHEAMTRAAEATFTALDRLCFNHQHLDQRVNELIQCAKSLSAIDQSVPGNDDYEKLVFQCSEERMKLEKIMSAHAQTVASVIDSRKYLQALLDNMSSTRNWLFVMEAEALCSEVELRDMEDKLEKISKEKEMLERNYVTASKDLEETVKLRELREAERDEAKAAFDRARALLRG